MDNPTQNLSHLKTIMHIIVRSLPDRNTIASLAVLPSPQRAPPVATSRKVCGGIATDGPVSANRALLAFLSIPINFSDNPLSDSLTPAYLESDAGSRLNCSRLSANGQMVFLSIPVYFSENPPSHSLTPAYIATDTGSLGEKLQQNLCRLNHGYQQNFHKRKERLCTR